MRVSSFVLFFLLSVSTLPAQNEIINLLKEGKFGEARSMLPALVKSKPNDPTTIYLRGMLAIDGEKARGHFEKLVSDHPRSEFADDALMQIGEYRYARGLYVSAERTLLQIPRDYPDSEHIERAIELLMRALMVTGKKDTAEMFLTEFKKKWKNLNLRLPEDETAKPVSPPEPADSGRGNFTVQIGAFGSEDNAKRQQEIFRQRGYRVELGKKVTEGRTLHLVWVGEYASQEEALEAARDLQAKFGVNYGIVDKSGVN